MFLFNFLYGLIIILGFYFVNTFLKIFLNFF
uniref:Uncharacterized protein n=1 Tax=Siphoviridae sp. ctHjK2 TaxID=2827831 RepID=A0A8S5SQX2_9CAUD|nr:MAG TPA: hypothetical protein [Siphoviridae sp. ctHjK2]